MDRALFGRRRRKAREYRGFIKSVIEGIEFLRVMDITAKLEEAEQEY